MIRGAYQFFRANQDVNAQADLMINSIINDFQLDKSQCYCLYKLFIKHIYYLYKLINKFFIPIRDVANALQLIFD